MCAGLGVVPLPDTAIDFSDLRSQSSRMNERVSCRILSLWGFLELLLHPCHELQLPVHLDCIYDYCGCLLHGAEMLFHKCRCWNDVDVINLIMTEDFRHIHWYVPRAARAGRCAAAVKPTGRPERTTAASARGVSAAWTTTAPGEKHPALSSLHLIFFSPSPRRLCF